MVSPPQTDVTQSDGFGFDLEFTERVKNVALWFYRKYQLLPRRQTVFF